MARESDKDADAFRVRMHSRNRQKRSCHFEEPREPDAKDSSKSRPPKRRLDGSSARGEWNESGDSSWTGANLDVMSIQNSKQQPRTSQPTARDELGSLGTPPPALFVVSRSTDFLHQRKQMQHAAQQQLANRDLVTSGDPFNARMEETSEASVKSSLPCVAITTMDPALTQILSRASSSSSLPSWTESSHNPTPISDSLDKTLSTAFD